MSKMLIKEITIENFRGFAEKETIEFSKLNAFIGKNDVGKSTILEALDIFFNDGKGAVKIDKDDRNKSQAGKNIFITVSFTDYPSKIIIDADNQTSLENEYLLNDKKLLEIRKEYSGGDRAKSSICIMADHPSCKTCRNLLTLKHQDLLDIVNNKDLPCSDKTKNADLRKAIWDSCCKSNKKRLPIATEKEEARVFWKQIEGYLPHYALFQSDRKNQDSDSEVQDPIKEAVKDIMADKELKEQLDQVSETVKTKIESIVDDTLEELKNINEDVAKPLKSNVPDAKWADAFKNIGIIGDDAISLNKRGSGVRRLILLSFFRAKAKKKGDNVIYAVEEPETSQHLDHQKMLVDAFIEMSAHSQILITTHSPSIVQQLAKKEFNPNLVKKENSKINIISGKDLFNPKQLALHPIKSGNEISFLAFDYISQEFHTELYSFINTDHPDIFNENIEKNCEKRDVDNFIKEYKRKGHRDRYITLHEYIRHQIHHPENKENEQFTESELRESIEKMRGYLLNLSSGNQ